MAIDCECFCGERYRVPDEQAGALVECPKCGHLIMLPTAKLDDLDPFDVADELAPASADARISPGQQERHARLANMRKAPKGLAAPPNVVIETTSGFWGDVGAAFNHLTSLERAFAFLFIWFLSCVAHVFCAGSLIAASMGAVRALIFGVFGLLVYGYVSAYFMKCVGHAAGGERGSPPATVPASFIDDMAMPMLLWWGCVLFVQAPAILGTAVMAAANVDEGISDWIILTLIGIGGFFWPICILTVSLGGFSMLVRFDVLVSSILRSPVNYMRVVALAAVAVGPGLVLRFSGITGDSATFEEFFQIDSMLLRVATVGLECYAMLVCTQLVGLYYRHYKSDYPWELG